MKHILSFLLGLTSFAAADIATSPLLFENNVNTVMQKDQYGNYQNIAYLDHDNDMVIGPTDPRMSILTQIPINMFRPQPFSDFDEVTLDPKWKFTPIGSGSLALADSQAIINTGYSNNSGGELDMPNVPLYFVPGQKIYFYLTTVPNGNLDLEFGIKADDNNLIRFTRVEDDVAEGYAAETRANGQSNRYPDISVGDSVRRLFCIEIIENAVHFYIGTDAGQLVLLATQTADIPVGIGHAYMKFTNRYPTQRQVALDFVWTVRIR